MRKEQVAEVLFVDDNEARRRIFLSHCPGGQVATTAAEAIAFLQTKEVWDVVCLDHDLGDEVFMDSGRPDCGAEVVRWMVQEKPKVKLVIVHSFNAPAAGCMVADLIRAGYRATYAPFARRLVMQVAYQLL